MGPAGISWTHHASCNTHSALGKGAPSHEAQENSVSSRSLGLLFSAAWREGAKRQSGQRRRSRRSLKNLSAIRRRASCSPLWRKSSAVGERFRRPDRSPSVRSGQAPRYRRCSPLPSHGNDWLPDDFRRWPKLTSLRTRTTSRLHGRCLRFGQVVGTVADSRRPMATDDGAPRPTSDSGIPLPNEWQLRSRR
jgi:hypothetical protein